MSKQRLVARLLPLTVVLALLVAPCPAQAAPGDLDPSFGTGGKVTTNVGGGFDEAFAVALQPDRKIVAGGSALTGGSLFLDFAVARYSPNGALDPKFGTAGRVTTDFRGRSDVARAVALQPDGKIVAGGAADDDFALARYNPNGTLDTSFGVGGKVTTDFAGNIDEIFAVVLQPDRSILVGGSAIVRSAPGFSFDFALARYNPNGTLDTSFGVGGKVTTDFAGSQDQIFAVVLQPDRRILVGGVATTAQSDFALARYNPNGTLDTSFGVGGKVTTHFADSDSQARDIARDADGGIVALGIVSSSTEFRVNFALARYTPAGALDTTFGTGGKVTTNFTGFDLAFAMALQSDRKIVAAGKVSNDFALARYTPAGALDPTFGTGGKVTTDFAGGTDEASAVALQPGGRILLAGTAVTAQGDDFALARYVGDAAPPTCRITRTGTTTNVTFRDNLSGLATITLLGTWNATADVPTFNSGTTNPKTVVLNRVNRAQPGFARLRATDVAGNVKYCTPSGRIAT